MTDIPRKISHSVVETETISADGSGNLSLVGKWKGYYLTQIHVLASADDAVTLTINQHNGGQWGTITTTAATSGEYMNSDASAGECRYLTGIPTYTLSGMASGTLTLECVMVS